MERSILLIEGTRPDHASIARSLSDEGMPTTRAQQGMRGLALALQRRWDLILIDLSVPDCDGVELCRELRTVLPLIPIVLLGVGDGAAERIRGLDNGADDYVAVPQRTAELLARLHALLRRVERQHAVPSSDVIVAGDIVLRITTHTARVDGREVRLTAREFALLTHLARTPGRVFGRAELLSAVWGYSHSGYLHTVNTHINRLRRKIEPDPATPRYIRTVWGVGYKLTGQGDRCAATPGRIAAPERTAEPDAAQS